jgi:cytochrome c-type biogenesis protein CcmH
MIFWFLCALLTTATIVVLLLPLVRANGATLDIAEADVQVYKDQLSAIDSELERGLIRPTDAEAARTEVARRLLGVTGELDAALASPQVKPLSQKWIYGAAIFVLGFSLIAYLGSGRPGQPGTNHAERASQDPRNLSINDQIARVEARLRERPDDAAGWDVIAPVYLRLGRYGDAANAFKRAIALRGETPERLAGFGQSRLGMTNGVVTGDVKAAFEKLLKRRPKSISARFWLAMASEQAGDKAAAANAYQNLLSDPAVQPKLRRLLNERLAAVGGAPSAPKIDAPGTAQPPQTSTSPAPPWGEAGAAIAALPPAERMKVIQGMVEGLAERLEQDGNDPAGWQRLVRAYMVLGQRAKAMEALKSARKALAENGEALAELDRTAAGLGLMD